VKNEKLSQRYAQAVFSLAGDNNAIETVGNDLSSIARAIGEDETAHAFFVAPVIERKTKEQVLMSVFDGKVNDIALHALLLLVRKRREGYLDEIVSEYRKLELARRGAEPLVFTTARELPETELRAMVARLEQLYRKTFEVTVRVDPSLIGGVRITMDDRRIDGTVAGRLEELTRALFAQN
jgi:F-type H+-transporting ATPase subunit delta